MRTSLIDPSNIIADCKSGASGAGRNANQATLLCEITESFKPYGVSGHRHFPEIKQELESISGGTIGLTFTPHLVPMSRGIEATIYTDLIGSDADILKLATKMPTKTKNLLKYYLKVSILKPAQSNLRTIVRFQFSTLSIAISL